jgi:histidine triad (HIT) family protein
MKKAFKMFLWLVFVLFALFLWILFFSPIKPWALCPFCSSVVLEGQKFYEDEQTIALCTHRPITPGHVLVISKRHVERFEELTDEESLAITKTVKKVHQAVSKVFGTDPYLLHEKNGPEVGQSVYHVHFHYVPLKKDQYLWTLLPGLIGSQLGPALSHEEMKPVINELRLAIEAL